MFYIHKKINLLFFIKNNMIETTTNFTEQIKQDKRERIKNLPNLGKSERDMEEFLSFFEQSWINISTIREYLNKELLKWKTWLEWRNIFIEQFVTQLSFNEWKEKIIQDILEKWPFATPKDLSQAIADYIKSKMSYDWMEALFQITKIIDKLKITTNISNTRDFSEKKLNSLFLVLKRNWIELNNEVKNRVINANNNGNLKNEIIKVLTDFFDKNNWVKLTKYHLKKFKLILEDYKKENDITKLPTSIQKYLMDIEGYIKKNDIEWLSNYIFTNFKNDNFFRTVLHLFVLTKNYHKWMGYGNKREIYSLLEEVQTWVCRHYSIIMREVYNEIVKNWEWIKFSWESTMLYVLNDKNKHAYNLLAFDWANWNIEKQYIDITSYIIWWKLFKKTENVSNKQWEVWAKIEELERRISV